MVAVPNLGAAKRAGLEPRDAGAGRGVSVVPNAVHRAGGHARASAGGGGGGSRGAVVKWVVHAGAWFAHSA